MRMVCTALVACVALSLACGCSSSSSEPIPDYTRPGEVCPVHKQPLQEDTVPIAYGMPRWAKDMDLRRAMETEFPCANSRHFAGCVVKDPKKAHVSYCPECRKDEAAWFATDEKKR